MPSLNVDFLIPLNIIFQFSIWDASPEAPGLCNNRPNALSILYLRCSTIDRPATCPATSSFQFSIWDARDTGCCRALSRGLSILYLRCARRAELHAGYQAPACCFNSLFEMPRLGLMCRPQMNLYVSILYLRCFFALQRDNPLDVSFNSLFEMLK